MEKVKWIVVYRRLPGLRNSVCFISNDGYDTFRSNSIYEAIQYVEHRNPKHPLVNSSILEISKIPVEYLR